MTHDAHHEVLSAGACRGCALLCDDVQISAIQGQLEFSDNVCNPGRAWYQAASGSSLFAQPLVNHSPKTLDAAIRAAGRYLANAKAPLFVGIQHLATRSQQHFAELARASGGYIGPDFGNESGPARTAFQKFGRSTCTLGEVARGDGVVFWQTADRDVPPRLIDRFLKNISWIWFVGPGANQPTQARTSGDDRVRYLPTETSALLAGINWIRERFVHPELSSRSIGNRDPAWTEFAEALQNAKRATFFLGSFRSGKTAPDPVTDGLHQLTRSMNSKLPVGLMALLPPGNQLSAENVLAWSFGHAGPCRILPNAVSGTADSIGLRERLLVGAYDVALMVVENGTVPDPELFQTLRDRCGRKLVLLSYGESILNPLADVVLPCSLPGWDATGDFYRMDDQAIALEKLATTDRVEASQILEKLAVQLKMVTT